MARPSHVRGGARLPLMTPLNDLRRGTEGRDAMMFGRIKEEEVQRGRNGEAGRTAGRRKWWLIMRPGCCLASRDAGRPAGRPRLDCARHRSTLTARPAVSRRWRPAGRKPHVQRNYGPSYVDTSMQLNFFCEDVSCLPTYGTSARTLVIDSF